MPPLSVSTDGKTGNFGIYVHAVKRLTKLKQKKKIVATKKAITKGCI